MKPVGSLPCKQQPATGPMQRPTVTFRIKLNFYDVGLLPPRPTLNLRITPCL